MVIIAIVFSICSDKWQLTIYISPTWSSLGWSVTTEELLIIWSRSVMQELFKADGILWHEAVVHRSFQPIDSYLWIINRGIPPSKTSSSLSTTGWNHEYQVHISQETFGARWQFAYILVLKQSELERECSQSCTWPGNQRACAYQL